MSWPTMPPLDRPTETAAGDRLLLGLDPADVPTLLRALEAPRRYDLPRDRWLAPAADLATAGLLSLWPLFGSAIHDDARVPGIALPVLIAAFLLGAVRGSRTVTPGMGLLVGGSLLAMAGLGVGVIPAAAAPWICRSLLLVGLALVVARGATIRVGPAGAEPRFPRGSESVAMAMLARDTGGLHVDHVAHVLGMDRDLVERSRVEMVAAGLLTRSMWPTAGLRVVRLTPDGEDWLAETLKRVATSGAAPPH